MVARWAVEFTGMVKVRAWKFLEGLAFLVIRLANEAPAFRFVFVGVEERRGNKRIACDERLFLPCDE